MVYLFRLLILLCLMEFPRPYQLDKPISNLRVFFVVIYFFIQISKEHSVIL